MEIKPNLEKVEAFYNIAAEQLDLPGTFDLFFIRDKDWGTEQHASGYS